MIENGEARNWITVKAAWDIAAATGIYKEIALMFLLSD
jgi:hypothetical protein